jgi:DeoR/GlpR family transcriptional regulator of sugar metabolism
MLNIGSIKMILADYSKFSQVCLNWICEVDKINHIFTDWNTPGKEIIKMQDKGVHIHVAKRP